MTDKVTRVKNLKIIYHKERVMTRESGKNRESGCCEENECDVHVINVPTLRLSKSWIFQSAEIT